MASCGLTIPGSGTVSTRTSWQPCQVSARIFARSLDLGLSCGLLAPGGTGIGRHLPRFDQLLEAPEVAPRLEVRLALQDLGDRPARKAARRDVLHRQAHARTAPRREFEEFDSSLGLDLRLRLAVPG